MSVGLDYRNIDMDIMKVMMYILLDNSPTKFMECCQETETFRIRSFRWPKSLSLFLEKTMYPPMKNVIVVSERSGTHGKKDYVEIAVADILERQKELLELDKRLSPVYLSSEECEEIMGIV